MTGTTSEQENPRQPGEKVRQELEKLVETVWSGSERALDALGLSGLTGKGMFPAVDIIETDDSVEVVANMPGIDPDKIDISLVGNMLTISGTHPLRESAQRGVVHRRERPRGDFARSLPLPCTVNPDSVTAVSQNGVLEVTLSKPAAEQTRQIQIQVKSSESHTEPAHHI